MEVLKEPDGSLLNQNLELVGHWFEVDSRI